MSKKRNLYNAATPAIFKTSTFGFPTTEELVQYNEDLIAGRPSEYFEYGRYGNPTVDDCEDRLAELEGAESAVLFPSGMAAITTVLFSSLRVGDHILIGSDCYRRTRQFCTKDLARLGVETTEFEMGNYTLLESLVRPNTRWIITESPTNPYLRVTDLDLVVDIARRHEVPVIIDSTFATPINQKPIEFGVDLVIHSATKYLGGHNSFLSGVVAGRKELIDPIRDARGVYGPMPDADTAYSLIQALETLEVRIARHNHNGLAVAEFLEGHPRIERVWYPSLPSHPDHSIATEQFNGCGGVVTFTYAGDRQDTRDFIDRLEIPLIAPSLGATRSLIEMPRDMSFYDRTPEECAGWGIHDNLVRFSVGIEPTDELIGDLAFALEDGRGARLKIA